MYYIVCSMISKRNTKKKLFNFLPFYFPNNYRDPDDVFVPPCGRLLQVEGPVTAHRGAPRHYRSSRWNHRHGQRYDLSIVLITDNETDGKC